MICSFIAFLKLIISFFNIFKNVVVTFSKLQQLIKGKMKQKTLDIFLGLIQKVRMIYYLIY